MADNSNCKLKISIVDGLFEVSGDRKFVQSQIKEFKNVIDDMIETSITSHDILMDDLFDEDIYEEFDDEDFDEDDYFIENDGNGLPLIFDEDDDEIIISGDIPGETKSGRTVNAALLYAYARQLQGSDEASVDEIRKVCEIHEFLDSSNFSTYLKSGAPKLYEDIGKGTDRIITLTKKGRKKAEKLIDEITVK